MKHPILSAIACVVGVYAVLSRVAKRVLGRPLSVGETRITALHDDTRIDHEGRVSSIQSADVTMATAALDAIWSPLNLERLARTYWRFLTRCTLGLIRVDYSEAKRYVVFLRRPFVLLVFHQPEYALNDGHGQVRWRIENGILVAPQGYGADGFLKIDVRRSPGETDAVAALHVEVEVANFYPRIAWGIAAWVYQATQSRIHVLVTYGFLRSLARLDLADSRVGRFAVKPMPEPAEPVRAPDQP